jgi:hypothetical protein
MKYLEGLIEWESDGLKSIPTNILEQYIVDIGAELEDRKKDNVNGFLQSKRNCFECNEELNKEELFCSYCRRQ